MRAFVKLKPEANSTFSSMYRVFLDALASLGSMFESESVSNVLEILSNLGHIFRVCSEYVQSVFRVCSVCVQIEFKVSSECVQSVFRVCSECSQSVFRVWSEFVQSVFRVC